MKRFLLMLLTLALALAACEQEAITEESTESHEQAESSKEIIEIESSSASENAESSALTESEESKTSSVEQTKGYELMLELTLEEKVGQLFLAAFPDVGAKEYINEYKLGGFIMFAREFRNNTPEGIRETVDSLQSAADIPLLFAVDEEGGDVCRISAFTQYREKRFYSPRYLYSHGGIDAIRESEKEKCALLGSLGINVNMAPVCDITTEKGAFMYNRSLGQDAETTSEFVRSVIDTTDSYNIGNVLKHFPGYGNNDDTHTGIAIDQRSLEELESVDIIPFKAGVEAGCGAILVSHTVIECMDNDLPASLSPEVNRYIRENLGFDGVLVTDDLSMQAITDRYGDGEAAILAVIAGNDLICCSKYKTAYTAVLNAVRDGRISEEQINKACARVLDWKYKIGIIE